MPRRKIREYQAKRLFSLHYPRFHPQNQQLDLPCYQPSSTHDFASRLSPPPGDIKSSTPSVAAWDRVVVKPDMLFGKRGASGMVILGVTPREALQFLNENMGKNVQMGGLTGVVDHFIIEPFIPHDVEYPKKNTISFSAHGGIHIEENWDKVRQVDIEVGDSIDGVDISVLFEVDFPSEYHNSVVNFIKTSYKIFEDLNFHFLEMNPFTIIHGGNPRPLDMRAELDDCALFKNANKWKVDGEPVEFPDAFGKALCEEEKIIRSLDEQTGASLKLTVLNPQGRIWGMIAGGGASVIYADTVADLGYGHELGNYGEYSGDPSEEDTFQYASKLLALATRNTDDGRRRALLIGGAIANFTDVAATFAGIIRALRDYVKPLLQSNMKIFVRRGGPNYKVGLQRMRDLESELGIPFEVYGPEVNMTRIVKLAINWISDDDGADTLRHEVHSVNGNGIHHL